MQFKSAFLSLATLVVGLGLGQAQATIISVDEFSDLGTPPASGNVWGQASVSTMGGARFFSKSGSIQQWFTPDSNPAPTPTVPAGQLRLQTGGSTNTASNQYYFTYSGSDSSASAAFDPKVDVSGMKYLYVEGTFDVQSTTQAIARLGYGSGASASLQLASADYDASKKLWRFDISSFSSTVDLAQLQRVQVQFNALGNVNDVDRIFFSDSVIPEPGTFALAGLAAVGLMIARRKMK